MNNFKLTILDIIILTCISCLANYLVFMTVFAMPMIYLQKVFFVYLIAWIFVFLIHINKKVLISFLILSLSILAFFIIKNHQEVFLFWENFINWVMVSLPYKEILEQKPYGQFLEKAIWISVFLITLLPFYLRKFPIFNLIFTGIIFALCLYFSITHEWNNYLTIYADFLILITLIYFSSLYKKSVLSFKTSIITFASITCVFVLLINTIPLDYTSSKLIQTVDDIQDYFSSSSADISTKLGGDNDPSEHEYFQINNTEDLYLKTEVYDIYTGYSFEKSETLENSYKNTTDTLSPSTTSYYYEYNITFLDYSSKIFPSPNGLMTIMQNSELISNAHYTSNNEVYFNNSVNQKSFDITYYPLTTLELYNALNSSNDIFDTINSNYDDADYFSLPDSVTDRTYELAQALYNSAYEKYNFDYCTDIQQQAYTVIEIASYLTDNYEYTLTPDEVQGEDFVDSFLFEHQEGYCTSFSSSLFVLLRTLDIPCLYVVGFTIPATTDGYTTVTQENLHAWVEIPFQDGNIVIDPSGVLFYNGTADDETATPEATTTPTTEPTAEPTTEPTTEPDNTIEPTPTPEILADEETEQNSINSKFLWKILLIILFILLIVLSLILYIRYKNKKIRNILKSNDVEILYSAVIRLLKLMKITRQPGETVREFVIRVHTKFNLSKKVNLTKLIIIIETYLYGDKNDIDNIQDLKIFARLINSQLKNNMNTVLYLILI